MLAFGLVVGYGIVYVRTRTSLSSDTVIGVFFAFAIGLAAMLRKVIQSRQLFSLEDFLFGDPLLVRAGDVVHLALLALLTFFVLGAAYNHLMLSGFNTSLALSRRVPVRLVNYAFVLLLALIVNLCLRYVGALLINALLVVPAATAVNLTSNLRRLFWWSVGLCLLVCLCGHWVSWEVEVRTHYHVKLGVPGTIILLAVGLFVGSLLAEPLRRWRSPGAPGVGLANAPGPPDNTLRPPPAPPGTGEPLPGPSA
jgi:zinc transport system permease protein